VVGGQTQAQVGVAVQAAGRAVHERDVPEPGTPPLKL
jgi:hypothetical protein